MCKFCKPDEFGDGVEITKMIKSKEVRIGLIFNAMSWKLGYLTEMNINQNYD